MSGKMGPLGASLLPPGQRPYCLLMGQNHFYLFRELQYSVPNRILQNTSATTFISAKKAEPNKSKTDPAGPSCSSEVWHRLLNLMCLPSGLSSCSWLLLNSWTLSWHRFLSFVFLTSLLANKFPSSSPKYRDCFWKNLPRSPSLSTLLTLARLSPLL